MAFLDGDDFLTPWALEVYDRIAMERKPTLIFGRSSWFEGDFPSSETLEIERTVKFVEYPTWIGKDRPREHARR